MKDFFISYNKADKAWAEWIAWILEETGHTTVLQAWDFRPGSNFVGEMNKATIEAERTMPVLSPDYLSAEFTQPEWFAAFARDPKGEKGILVPVLVRECNLEGLLAQIVHIKLVGLDEAAAKTALLDGIKRGRGKPATEPSFPAAAPRSVPVKPRFPGTLPSIWNVPHHRNPNFTGREEILLSVRDLLTSGSPAALTQAMTGLGGVGKTSLALEYVYRYRADYSVVWWLPSEEPAKLSVEYGALAKALDLPIKDSPNIPEVARAVRRWLDQNSGWLLVFDNASSPDELLEFRPQGETGHVIISSRNQNWGTTSKPLTVKVWPRDEAVDFMLKRTRQDEEQAASDLAYDLGYLPLALEHAGAYIETRACTIKDYLKRFRDRGPQLLKHVKPSADYPFTVAATWEISFEQVRKESPEAADLMNLLAFFASDDIPRDILCDGAQQLPEPLGATVCDRVQLDDLLAVLRNYSLADVQPDAVSVHRLVQAVTHDLMSDEDKETWAGAAVKLLSATYPFDGDNLSTWPLSQRLLPHGMAAAHHAEKLHVTAEKTSMLLNSFAEHLRFLARWDEAKRALERALRINEEVLGPDHSEVASILSNLGTVLRNLGELQLAKESHERALGIDERMFGPDHPKVANRLNNLGAALRDIGDLPVAKEKLERALRIDEAIFGPEHPNVAITLNNLGMVLKELGDLPGAKERLERALRIEEAVFGPDHSNVARDVSNLGLVLKDLGDHPAAKERLERAMRIEEAVFGPDHPNVATVLNNLGLVVRDLGDLPWAKESLERALRIDKAAFGTDHLHVARDLNNLGFVRRDLGEIDAARADVSHALGISRKVLGEDHPSTKIVRENLAALDEN